MSIFDQPPRFTIVLWLLLYQAVVCSVLHVYCNFIGASVSEPHTSESNGNFSYII